jgi:hypothetical protein
MILPLIYAVLLTPHVSAVYFCPENPVMQFGICSERCGSSGSGGTVIIIGDTCNGEPIVPFPPQCCSSGRPATTGTLVCKDDGGCVMAGYAADTSSRICTCWSTCLTHKCTAGGEGWVVKSYGSSYQISGDCFMVRTRSSSFVDDADFF